MNHFVLGLNDLIFNPARGLDRVAIALLVAAGLAVGSHRVEGVGTCVAMAILIRSRRAA